MRFSVTYETITEESAEYGDFEDTGFVCENVGLREAVESLGYGSQGTEASDYPIRGARWITSLETNNGTREYYEKGVIENRSLHFPVAMTEASKLRLMRLLGVKM